MSFSSSRPSASATATPAQSGELTFDFPADVKLIFDYQTTGDATKGKIVSDYETLQKILVAAQLDPGHPDPRIAQYATGQALIGYRGALQSMQQQNHTVIGTKRYYAAEVVELQGNYAKVAACEDVSQWFQRDVGTGKPVPHATAGANFYRTEAAMELDGTVWKVSLSGGQVVSSC